MPLIGEIIDRKKKETFTGRKDQIDCFVKLLEDSEKGRIFNIYGIGGIGKTTLLNEFIQICNDKETLGVLVEARRSYSFKIMREIRNQIQLKNVSNNHFSNFDSALKRRGKIEAKLLKAMPKKGGIASEAIFSSVSDAGAASGTIVGTLVGGPGGGVVGAPIGAGIGRLLGNLGERCFGELINRGISEEDAKFCLNWQEELTKHFIEGLNNLVSDVNSIILIFDTYEDIIPTTDDWVRETFIRRLDARIFVVIAGREKLFDIDHRWNDFASIIKPSELERFTEDEAKEFFQKRDILNPLIIDYLIEFTDRLPLAMDICADMVQQIKDVELIELNEKIHEYDVIGQIIRSFMRQVKDNDVREMIDTCAILRQFNVDILSSIMGKDVTNIFKQVKKYSFVKRHGDGTFYLHDTVRDFILREIKASSWGKYIELNKLALQFYNENNFYGEAVVLERLYHSLCADENKGMELFAQRLEQLNKYQQYSMRDAVLKEIANFDFKKDKNKTWRDYCKGCLALNKGDWESSKETFLQLLKINSINPLLRSFTIGSLGELYTGKGRYSEALILYQDDLKINQKIEKDVNQILSRLAELSGILGDYDNGIKYAKESIEACKDDEIGEAIALIHLGTVYRLQGRTVEGIQSMEKSLEIFLKSENTYGVAMVKIQIARLYTHIGEWEKAEKYLNESKNVFESLNIEYHKANAFLFLGNIRRFQKKWKEARDLYTKALTLHKKMDSKREIGPLYGSMGIVYHNLGNSEKALDYLEKSLTMKREQEYERGVGISHIYLGDYYFKEDEYDKATENFNIALKIGREYDVYYLIASASTQLCEIYYVKNLFDKISELSENIVPLAQNYKYYALLSKFYVAQGNVLLRKKEYDRAFEIYAEACKTALKYNRYMLDGITEEITRQIIDLRKNNGEKSKSFRNYLINYWKNNNLVDEEKKVREREIGDGISQTTFIEKLKEI